MTHQVLLLLVLSAMHAYDTTVYSIGETADNTVTSLNKALSELNSWCIENSLTPHSAKCEAMLLPGGPPGAIDEKTAHKAAKFCYNWSGSNRVDETHSSFGRYYL